MVRVSAGIGSVVGVPGGAPVGASVPVRGAEHAGGASEHLEQRAQLWKTASLGVGHGAAQPLVNGHGVAISVRCERMRHTKIVATLGPATSRAEEIRALIDAGVDVFRLNFSHGSHEAHGAVVQRIRAAADAAGRAIGILQDLSGPKIRTGRLEGGRPLLLTPGDGLRIAAGDFEGRPGRIATTYAGLVASVRPGDTLLLDDGHIELRVEDADGQEIVATVVDGGTLGEHKGINAPGVPLPAEGLTAKDLDDLRFGAEVGADLLAVSFVRRAADITTARAALREAGAGQTPIVAKLERPEALDDIEGILDACDAIMVARGDLGLELPLERVPGVQKRLTRLARQHGRPVIVATQVFESMRTEPRPTRAEVSDAANAVDDGVDAIMLAGETAVGDYPERAVRTLDTVLREAETLPSSSPVTLEHAGALAGHGRALCESAVTLAGHAHAAGIVALTRSGETARLLAALRPPAPIYAATDRVKVARRLALLWGVAPVMADLDGDPTSTAARIGADLVARGLIPASSVIVVVGVNPDLAPGPSNFLKVQRV
jgi:pyruvate kinase